MTSSSQAPTDAGTIEERVLAAARCSLLERGVQKTRIDHIAAEVGLLRPNLYRYFPSKNALVLQVLLEDARALHRDRRRELPIQGPVAPLIVESIMLGFKFIASERSPVFNICFREDPRQTAQLLTQPEAVAVESEYWIPVLQHGRSRGEIVRDLDDGQIVRWFVGIQFLLHEHTDFLGGETMAREYLTKLAVPGVLSARGRKAA